MFINNNLLRFVYNLLLVGMPQMANNPINKNILHAPFNVNEMSTYINYRLDNEKINSINKILKKHNNFNLIPASIIDDQEKDYFLSINIYNCTSPIFSFLSEEPATRCEINTYVVDKNQLKGTLIIDYISNIISMDADNIFKLPNTISFNKIDNKLFGNAKNNNIDLNFDINLENHKYLSKLSNSLIDKTENIFYNSGVYDKLYFDSTLLKNTIVNCNDFNINFKFYDILFDKVDSVFYFENKINFVGGMWYNIFDISTI